MADDRHKLQCTITDLHKEIEYLNKKIESLEKDLDYESSMMLYRQFTDDPKPFLDMPFKDYIHDERLAEGLFKKWFIDLVEYSGVKTYNDLLSLSDKELRKYSGIGDSRIRFIRNLGNAMDKRDMRLRWE